MCITSNVDVCVLHFFYVTSLNLILLLFSGLPKPKARDQPTLIASVVRIVKRMIPPFNSGDIKYVRNLKAGRGGIFNVECRSVAVATAVKSSFANLIKSDSPPSYLKNVRRNYFCLPIIMI